MWTRTLIMGCLLCTFSCLMGMEEEEEEVRPSDGKKEEVRSESTSREDRLRRHKKRVPLSSPAVPSSDYRSGRNSSLFSRVLSHINPFFIDYERLSASLEPIIANSLAKGIGAMAKGLQDITLGFADQLGDRSQEVVIRLGTSLEQGIGGAVKVGIEHLEEALKEGGTLQTRLNSILLHTMQRNLAISGSIVVLTIGGSTFVYFGTRTGWRLIARNLMRPKLIIDSSRKTVLARIQERVFAKKHPPTPEMICSKELEERLRDIVRATRNIYEKTNAGATNVKYRNLMLWGPPGTGKTMFAKRLARESGLEWAYMSGSSFAKFHGGEGIEALDELFAWANRSKGLLLFIDEAEAFLAQREQMDINSSAYQLLTNFLNHTGERSNTFMLVFATNHKRMLDTAVHRRIDDLIEMPLPKVPERFRVLALYRNKILFDIAQNGAVFVDAARMALSDTKVLEMAEQTEGLSNGDLEGIINVIKTDADITDTGLVTLQLVDRAVRRALEKHELFHAERLSQKRALYRRLWLHDEMPATGSLTTL